MEKPERTPLGQKPLYTAVDEEKLRGKLQKRLDGMLARAEKTSPEKACRDGLFDLLRYLFGQKYLFKEIIYGKDRFFWDMLLAGIVVALLLAVIGIAVLIFG